MSHLFALEHGSKVQNEKAVVEFADGSVAVTLGAVQVDLAVRKRDSTEFRRVRKAVFYLLDGLRQNLIVGEDALEELEVFTKGHCSLF